MHLDEIYVTDWSEMRSEVFSGAKNAAARAETLTMHNFALGGPFYAFFFLKRGKFWRSRQLQTAIGRLVAEFPQNGAFFKFNFTLKFFGKKFQLCNG